MYRAVLLASYFAVSAALASSGWAQSRDGGRVWSHTYPGESAPTVYGYGAVPRGRGPIARYTSSPTDQAIADSIVNFSRPVLGLPPVIVQPHVMPPALASNPSRPPFSSPRGWRPARNPSPMVGVQTPAHRSRQGRFPP